MIFFTLLHLGCHQAKRSAMISSKKGYVSGHKVGQLTSCTDLGAMLCCFEEKGSHLFECIECIFKKKNKKALELFNAHPSLSTACLRVNDGYITPLFLAMSAGNQELANYFIVQKDSNLNQFCSQLGGSILMVAIIQGFKSIFTLLLEKGSSWMDRQELSKVIHFFWARNNMRFFLP